MGTVILKKNKCQNILERMISVMDKRHITEENKQGKRSWIRRKKTSMDMIQFVWRRQIIKVSHVSKLNVLNWQYHTCFPMLSYCGFCAHCIKYCWAIKSEWNKIYYTADTYNRGCYWWFTCFTSFYLIHVKPNFPY